MNQDERRLYLIEYLMREEEGCKKQQIPNDVQGQRDLLRALMNVRMPKRVDAEFLKVQNEYLQARNRERGITDVRDLTPVEADGRLYIWQGDITTLQCDAIVNACNSQMLGCFSPMHACIDNFIHTYAGIQLRLEMNEIMTKQRHEEPVGQAKITSGYNLPAKYILHTVGPMVHWDVTKEDEQMLAKRVSEMAQEITADYDAVCLVKIPCGLISVVTGSKFINKFKHTVKAVFKESEIVRNSMSLIPSCTENTVI